MYSDGESVVGLLIRASKCTSRSVTEIKSFNAIALTEIVFCTVDRVAIGLRFVVDFAFVDVEALE